MSQINDGGPAFPMTSGDEPRVDQTTHYNEGMSLLDWFAGQALIGLLTQTSHSESGHPIPYWQGDGDGLEHQAFKIAINMLVERKLLVEGKS